MSTLSTQRCPRCGNENNADSFSCSFCGKRLRIERIENNFFFRRYEKEWNNPLPFYLKIFYLFREPSRAFWDINHRRKDAPGWLIFLLNSLLYGLMGLAFMSKFQITLGGSPYSLWLFPYYLTFFITFFVFGLVFQLIFFSLLIWLYGKAANYAVDFSERLETRFGDEKDTGRDSEMSPFSIYKGGTLLQGQQAHKFKMLLSSFAPFLLMNVAKIFIILAALPYTTVSIESGGFNSSTINTVLLSPVLAVMDVLDAIALIWASVLMALAIRELSNSSTFRVLISSLIIGGSAAVIFYFMRPTLFGVFYM